MENNKPYFLLNNNKNKLQNLPEIKQNIKKSDDMIGELFSKLCFMRAQLMHYHVHCKTPPARQATAKFADMIGEASEFANESWQGWSDSELPQYEYPKLLWDRNPWKYLKDTSKQILNIQYKAIPDESSPVHLAIQEVLKIVGEAMFHLKGLN